MEQARRAERRGAGGRHRAYRQGKGRVLHGRQIPMARPFAQRGGAAAGPGGNRTSGKVEGNVMKLGEMIEQRAAFGEALLELGAANPAVIVFDADVATSTYTARFREAFPKRFIQCRHRRAEHGRHGRRRQHAGTHPLGLHLRRVLGQAGGGPGARLGRLCPVQRQAERRPTAASPPARPAPRTNRSRTSP